MGKKYIEKRRRGFLGWIMLTSFWLVNLGMAALLVSYMVASGEQAQTLTSEAEQAGFALGTAMGVSMLVSLWAGLALITGLLAFMTRGRKELIEQDI